MRPDAALTRLAVLANPHRSGHQCHGTWFNPQAGKRQVCPTLTALDEVADDVRQLHAQVHEAAHNTDQATAVAEGMTGFVLADLGEEEREGWLTTARMAIEALAEELDRDLALEARAAAVRARLEETR